MNQNMNLSKKSRERDIMKLRVVLCCCAALSLMMLYSVGKPLKSPTAPLTQSPTATKKITVDDAIITQWLAKIADTQNKISKSSVLKDLMLVNDDIKKVNDDFGTSLKGKHLDKNAREKIKTAKREISQLWHTRLNALVENVATKKTALSAEERKQLQSLQASFEQVKKQLESRLSTIKVEGTFKKTVMDQITEIGKRIDNFKVALAAA